MHALRKLQSIIDLLGHYLDQAIHDVAEHTESA